MRSAGCGASRGRAPRRGGAGPATPGGRAPGAPALGAAPARARAATRPASSSTGKRAARAISPSSWRFSMPSGSGCHSGRAVGQHAGAAFGGRRGRSLRAASLEDLPRQRHGRRDRLLEGLGAVLAHVSCRGRARRAGTGSGSCACRWRAAGSASSARPAARRPAASPSKLKTTESVKRNSFCTCSAVQAVPSVATAFAKPELGQGDDVHVALDDERVAALADAPVRASNRPYSSRPLLNTGVSGEFRYFGSPRSRTRPPKPITVALHRADREHDPVAEAVVALAARRLGVARPLVAGR